MKRLNDLFESAFDNHAPTIACACSFFLGALFALAAVAVREGVR